MHFERLAVLAACICKIDKQRLFLVFKIIFLIDFKAFLDTYWICYDVQRRSQIDPKWCPGDPWVTPGASLGPPLSFLGSPPGWFSDASEDS